MQILRMHRVFAVSAPRIIWYPTVRIGNKEPGHMRQGNMSREQETIRLRSAAQDQEPTERSPAAETWTDPERETRCETTFNRRHEDRILFQKYTKILNQI